MFARSGVVLLAVLTLLALITTGCVPPATSDPQPPYVDNTLDLNDADNARVDSLCARLAALDQTGSEDALAALLAEITAAYPDVQSAVRGADGSSILLTFTSGALALINNDAVTFQPADPQARAIHPPAKVLSPSVSRVITGSFACSGRIFPATRKALVVNSASVSNPSTAAQVAEIRSALLAKGWTDADITVRTRDEATSFSPDSLLDVHGFGLVYIIAQGVYLDAGSGSHFYIQCCGAGSWADIMTADKWLVLVSGRNDGSVIRTQTRNESGGYEKEVYLRDDFFATQLGADAGAQVHFLAGNSWSAANALAANGVGSALGWDGQIIASSANRTLLGMITQMTQPGAYTTDEAGLAALLAAGLGTASSHDGGITPAKLPAIAGDFYLPAWGRFTIDTSSLPDGAVRAKAKITYPACATTALEFPMDLGETVDVDYLMPGEAQISVEFYDNTDTIIGAGLDSATIHGGLNAITLRACQGELHLTTGHIPTDGENAATSIRLEFTYRNGMTAPAPVVVPANEFYTWVKSVWAGPLTINATALTATNRNVGRCVLEEDVDCDSTPFGPCFGWVKLAAADLASDVKTVRVTFDDADAAGPFTFVPGASVSAYGFMLGHTVSYTAELLDVGGNTLASTSASLKIECGENVVTIRPGQLGVVVSASPNRISASGGVSTITATVRYWRDGDVTVPTGAVVAGASVFFSTTAGTLNGAVSLVTNSAGQASVTLVGTSPAVATVTAQIGSTSIIGRAIVQIGDSANNLRLITFDYSSIEIGIEAKVTNENREGVPGITVEFETIAGSVTFSTPRVLTTGGNGIAVAHIPVNGPMIGIVQVTVPSGPLVRQTLVHAGETVSASPTSAAMKIDVDELKLRAQVSPDISGLGVPVKYFWFTGVKRTRPIRQGTAQQYPSFSLLTDEDSPVATVKYGGVPDTTATVKPTASLLVDGEWVGLSDFGKSAVIDFYSTGTEVSVTVEGRIKNISSGNTPYYKARIVAYYKVTIPDGCMRYIVRNPNDDGTQSWDGYSDGASAIIGGPANFFLAASENKSGDTEPPTAWLTEAQQRLQAKFNNISLIFSPATDEQCYNGGVALDIWDGW